MVGKSIHCKIVFLSVLMVIYPGIGAVFAMGQSVLRVGPGRTTNHSPSSPRENFARGQWLWDGGSSRAPQPDCRVSQSVKPDRSLQIPADTCRFPQMSTNTGRSRQIPRDACRPRWILTLVHRSSRESVVHHNH